MRHQLERNRSIQHQDPGLAAVLYQFEVTPRSADKQSNARDLQTWLMAFQICWPSLPQIELYVINVCFRRIQTTRSQETRQSLRAEAFLFWVFSSVPRGFQPAENKVNSSKEAQTAISRVFRLRFWSVLSTGIGVGDGAFNRDAVYHQWLLKKVQRQHRLTGQADCTSPSPF